MDGSRFDAWTRAVANRRMTIGVLLAGLLPIGANAKPKPARDQPTAAQCLANGQLCGKGSGKKGKKDTPCKKCCSQFATPRSQGPQRCACKPENGTCTSNRQCCGGQCTTGQCGPCPPGQAQCGVDGCVNLLTSNRNCGNCGAACAEGQVCQSASCTCTAASCDGCCDGDACRPGTGDTNCGTGGDACVACIGTGVTCGGGGTPGVCGCTSQSDATTCEGTCGSVQNNCGQTVNCTPLCAGCCNGAVCRPGDTFANCGSGGNNCAACAGIATCQGGACCTTEGGTASRGVPCCAGLTQCAGNVCKANCCFGVTCTAPQECSGGVCATNPNCVGNLQNCVGNSQCCSDSCIPGLGQCDCSIQGEPCVSSSDCCTNPVPNPICIGFVCSS